MAVALILAALPSPFTNAIDIGPLSIRAYGLAIGIGVVLAVHIAQRRWEARGGDAADIASLAVWAVPADQVGVPPGSVGAETEQPGTPSCHEVASVLQSFLDQEVDEGTAERVVAHLEMCRRCGLEGDVYREIKASLSRSTPAIPELTLRRLRHFGEELRTGAGGSPQGTGI